MLKLLSTIVNENSFDAQYQVRQSDEQYPTVTTADLFLKIPKQTGVMSAQLEICAIEASDLEDMRSKLAEHLERLAMALREPLNAENSLPDHAKFWDAIKPIKGPGPEDLRQAENNPAGHLPLKAGDEAKVTSPKFGSAPEAYGDHPRFRTCDVCETEHSVAEKHKVHWYGCTNSIVCNDPKCKKIMDERYAAHCAEVDAQIAREAEYAAENGY
ncbi:MAG: hypothetical protein RSD49_16350 [Hafnia sp.]